MSYLPAIFRSAFAAALIVVSVIAADAADTTAVFQACMERAKDIARDLAPPSRRDTAFRGIAYAYARFGSIDQLSGALDEIRDERMRNDLILDFEKHAKVRSENPETAKQLLPLALRYALAAGRTEMRERFLRRIAYAHATNGDIESALRATALIETTENRNQSRFDVSQAQAQNKDIDGAIATAEPIPAGRWRDQAFAGLARAAARAGEIDRARELAARVQGPDAFPKELPKPPSSPRVQDTDFSTSLERARQITKLSERVNALIGVGIQASRSDQKAITRAAYQEARNSVRESGDGWLLVMVGNNQADGGFFEDAFETAEELRKVPYDRRATVSSDGLVALLLNIAQAQYRAGQKEKARSTVESVEPIWLEHKNMNMVTTFVSAAANVGNFDLARRIAAQVPDEHPTGMVFPAGSPITASTRPTVWQRIAVAAARNGDFSGAFQAISEIDGARSSDQPNIREFALSQIALEQARHDRLADAFKTVDQISRGESQVFALSDIAVKLKAGE